MNHLHRHKGRLSRVQQGSAVLLAGCALTFSVASWAAESESSGSFADAFIHDSEITVHLRSYYLERNKPAPNSDLEAWAGGGWLGYQSGWLGNVFRLGVVGYTSQPLDAPDDKDGTLLLRPNQEGYSVLGQAFGQLKFGDNVFTGYRQLINQPEVNQQDNRMTPNTFEAYTLGGKIATTNYFVGYSTKMKTRNSQDFRDFATVAGAVSRTTSEGMVLGGVDFKPLEALAVRFSAYEVPNILASGYTDAVWKMTPWKDGEVRLGAQYMYQSSVGDDLLTGSSFHASSGGVKADVQQGPLTVTVVYTQTAESANYRSPYGSWAGYTSMIVEDFDRAGEQAFMLGIAYDFAGLKLPGLSAFTTATYGSNAVNPTTKAPVSDKTEYDGTLDYRFSGDWPAWVKPLWLRARAVRDEDDNNGTRTVTRDFRFIANYEWVFK